MCVWSITRHAGFFLEMDYLALVLAGLALVLSYFLWRRSRKFEKPHLFFSALDPTLDVKKDLKLRLARLPPTFYILAYLLFLTAFTDPHYFVPKKHPLSPDRKNAIPTEGIAI